jgi:hypothetical protein
MKSAKLNLHVGRLCLPIYLTAFFVCAVLLFSCQKQNNPPLTPVSDEEASTVAQENADADAEFQDISEIGLSADADVDVSTDNGVNGRVDGFGNRVFDNLFFKTGPCTTITVNPNDSTYPKTVTIDYHDGCICRDGKFRKGAILLYFTKPLRRPGAQLTITLRDFYVNRKHIEGTKTITNLSAGNTHNYSVVVTDGKVTWPSGRGFKFEKIS